MGGRSWRDEPRRRPALDWLSPLHSSLPDRGARLIQAPPLSAKTDIH